MSKKADSVDRVIGVILFVVSMIVGGFAFARARTLFGLEDMALLSLLWPFLVALVLGQTAIDTFKGKNND